MVVVNERKLLTRIELDPGSGCWVWTGKMFGNGYGCWHPSKHVYLLAHRVAYECWIGTIPVGQEVCHHCDRKLCINPLHLFPGTHADNMQDYLRKFPPAPGPPLPGPGLPRGENHPSAKLSNTEVLALRAKHREGIGYRRLARIFNLTRGAVRYAVGRGWKHLGEAQSRGAMGDAPEDCLPRLLSTD